LGFCHRLGQSQINNLRRCAVTLQLNHDVAGLDVAMDEILFVYRAQTGGYLSGDFQCELHFQPAKLSYELVQRFPIDKLHRVEVAVATHSQVKHRSDVWMTHTGSSASLSNQPPARRCVTNELGVNNFQRHGTPKIDIDRFVRNSHRAATKLDRVSIVVRQDLVMFEAELRWRKDRLNG
jgi:hypothetical protein